MSVNVGIARKSVSAHTAAALSSVTSRASITVMKNRACLGDVAQRTMMSVALTRGIRRYVINMDTMFFKDQD